MKSSEECSSEEDYLFTVTSDEKLQHAEITIDGKSVKFVIDTGASVNIIDRNTWRNIGTELQNSKARLLPYGSDAPLELLGQFQATLQLNDNIVQSKVYVINKEDSGCLLGKDSALKLQIVQLEEKIEVVNHVSKEIEDILHVNEEIFEGVGKLRNFQLRLHIKEDVKPVAQPTRRVPISSIK